MAGTPCIYYGDEISMTGGMEPESRKCMIWSKEDQDLDMFAFVQKLISLRKQFKLFRTNKGFSFLGASKDENILSYRKSDHDSEILIMINKHDQVKDATLPMAFQNKTINDLWSAQEIKTTRKIQLKPYSFYILQLSKG
jgi:cyclomaltodextrinase